MNTLKSYNSTSFIEAKHNREQRALFPLITRVSYLVNISSLIALLYTAERESEVTMMMMVMMVLSKTQQLMNVKNADSRYISVLSLGASIIGMIFLIENFCNDLSSLLAHKNHRCCCFFCFERSESLLLTVCVNDGSVLNLEEIRGSSISQQSDA